MQSNDIFRKSQKSSKGRETKFMKNICSSLIVMEEIKENIDLQEGRKVMLWRSSRSHSSKIWRENAVNRGPNLNSG